MPERVAKLVREEMRPPPPPRVEEAMVPDEDIPEPEPELAEETPPENLPESAEQPLVAEAAPEDTKEKVKSKGILAFRDSFASRASLRPNSESWARRRESAVQAKMPSAGRSVRWSRPRRPGPVAALTSPVSAATSVAVARVSAVWKLTRVASSIGGEGGADRPLSGGAMAGRTDEEIQIVFDRYKAALYRLYNRELRKDPTLRGQIILRMTIEPDGSVSLCQLQSSDMDAPFWPSRSSIESAISILARRKTSWP